ncbi:MAG: crossover junction endodeoxyribonuclease RuvC [Thermoplasmatales archaeon]
MGKVLAVDPSSSSLGWAILKVKGEIVDVGVLYYSSKDSVSTRVKLIVREMHRIIHDYRLGGEDYFVTESSAGLVNPRSFLVLERVRGAVEAVAHLCGLQVLGRINPRSLHRSLLGIQKCVDRKTVKFYIREFISKEFGLALRKLHVEIKPANQDLFDALLVGYYFVKALTFLRTNENISLYLSDI